MNMQQRAETFHPDVAGRDAASLRQSIANHLLYTLGKPNLQPISVGIQQFNFIYSQQPHLIQATALLGMVLPVLLFFFSQRFFMRGIVITGVEK